jgi:hypothetical protein
MITVSLILFGLPLAISVVAYGASVWSSLEPPANRKAEPDSSSDHLPQ